MCTCVSRSYFNVELGAEAGADQDAYVLWPRDDDTYVLSGRMLQPAQQLLNQDLSPLTELSWNLTLTRQWCAVAGLSAHTRAQFN